LCRQHSAIAAIAIRAIIFKTLSGQEKTRGWAACFPTSNFKEGYGFLGLVAGEVVVVVVVLAGLVAGFSVVVVTGFLFSAVIMSVVKS
jgi:hypothetical protein